MCFPNLFSAAAGADLKRAGRGDLHVVLTAVFEYQVQ